MRHRAWVKALNCRVPCPVPDKPACCQSIRPVRMPCHPSGPKRPALATAISPATMLYASMPSVRVPQRDPCHGHAIGPGQVARSPLEHRPGPTSDDNQCLDRLPLNQARAGQNHGGGPTYSAQDIPGVSCAIGAFCGLGSGGGTCARMSGWLPRAMERRSGGISTGPPSALALLPACVVSSTACRPRWQSPGVRRKTRTPWLPTDGPNSPG